MLGTAIFYAAFLSTVLQINGLDDRQLQQVLRLLESRAANTKSSSSSSESSSGSDDTDSVEHTMRTSDVMKLIQQAIKNKKDTQNYVKDHKLKAMSNALNELYENSQYEFSKTNKDNSGIKNSLLEHFTQKDEKPLKNNNRERLSPNRLLGPVNYQVEGDSGTKAGLNKYSKIFVVLDPIALQKSRNTENLPKLLSRILAETVSTVDKSRQDKNKAVGSYYKGFAVNDNSKSRRFRRESRESKNMYGGVRDGDMDDEYRPKRPRSEHNAGGGGGGGGRTAIPYIRHRGDIYERDH